MDGGCGECPDAGFLIIRGQEHAAWRRENKLHGGDIYTQQIAYDFSVNINPCDSGGSLKEACEKAFLKMNCYPDTRQTEFCSSIARLEGISPEQVIGGSGASELFMAIVRSLDPKKALVLCPSFYGYRHALCALPDCRVFEYRLKEENAFALDEDFLSFLWEMPEKPDVILMASPNNPTGQKVKLSLMTDIADWCRDKETALVIDECFLRLTEDPVSMKAEIRDHPGLYVVDAFTKLFAIPGARVGYLCSCRENIDKVKKQLPEWNMSVLAQELGVKCAELLMRSDFRNLSAELIRREREFLTAGFRQLKIKVYPSQADFLLIRTRMDLYGRLKARGILIRDCSDYRGLGEGYCRIAVKTHEENEILLAAMEDIRTEKKGT